MSDDLEQLLRASVALIAANKAVHEAETLIRHQGMEINLLRAHVRVLECKLERARREAV